MKKNIYFLRHGESLENVGDKIRMKHKDAILTKNGVFQAEQVASRMKNINLDIVFTSHYDRALKTAEKIANDSDIDFSILDFAYERKYPESAYGLKRKSMEDVEIIDKFKKTWVENPGENPENTSESFFEFKNRIKKILETAEKSKFENIAFVVHGSILRSIMIYILTDGEFDAETYFSMYKKIGYSNTGLSLLEFSEKKGWKIVVWNDYSHL